MIRKIYYWKLRESEMQLGERTLIMGVINLTPDSFSDGGHFNDAERAYARALELEELGADIIDIGAESTRPGSQRISADEEWQRLVPVLKRLKGNLRVPLSLDTYKSEIAERALQYGIEIINDPSGLTFDPGIAKVAANGNVGLILNHMRGQPESWAKLPPMQDPIGTIGRELDAAISRARHAGVDKARIVIDPGLGFGKRKEQNSEILGRLSELSGLDYPVLVGASRKSFLAQPTEADTTFATAAAVTAAVLNGAYIVRVHDVGEMKSVVAVADEIVNAVGAVFRAKQLAMEERGPVVPRSQREKSFEPEKPKPTRPPLAKPVVVEPEPVVVEAATEALPEEIEIDETEFEEVQISGVEESGADGEIDEVEIDELDTEDDEIDSEDEEELDSEEIDAEEKPVPVAAKPKQAVVKPAPNKPIFDKTGLTKPYNKTSFTKAGPGGKPAFRKPEYGDGSRPPRVPGKFSEDRDANRNGGGFKPPSRPPSRPFDRDFRPGASRPPSRPFDRDRNDRPQREGDRPQFDRPRGDRPQGDRPQYDRPRGDRPQYERPQGDRPPFNRPQGDRPQYDRPRGDRPQYDRPQGDRPRFERSDSRPPRGDSGPPRRDFRPGGPPRSGPPRGAPPREGFRPGGAPRSFDSRGSAGGDRRPPAGDRGGPPRSGPPRGGPPRSGPPNRPFRKRP